MSGVTSTERSKAFAQVRRREEKRRVCSCLAAKLKGPGPMNSSSRSSQSDSAAQCVVGNPKRIPCILTAMGAYEDAGRTGASRLGGQPTKHSGASNESETARVAEPTEPASLPAGTIDPNIEEQQILAQLEALTKRHPERMPQFLDEIRRVIEGSRPPSTQRTLNSTQAAKRAGCTDTHLIRNLDRGRLGERDAEGRPRFSEAECDAFRREVRKPGRPRKAAWR